MDGVLIVDKPAGKTSHDVVAAIRHDLGGRKARRVGHAGTLDPFATGLLLVLVGRATRVQRFLMALPKTYEVVARFGAVSSTGDPEGEIVETGAPIRDPLVLPTGTLHQTPPAYSAVKVGGERAYKLARGGQTPEIPAREVTVYEAEELWRDPPRIGLRLRCSAGTYVRSYVADLGDAYCEELRRTRIGPFDVERAGEEVALADALGMVMEVRRVEGDDARRRRTASLWRGRPRASCCSPTTTARSRWPSPAKAACSSRS
jgi:tRNA pseudouridine55 synthase